MRQTLNLSSGILIALLTLVTYLRWLRVAQREHYEPGRVLAMATIWHRARSRNALVFGFVIAGSAMLSAFEPLLGLVAAVAWLSWPLGLGLVGDSSRLAFTDRVKRLAVVVVALHVVLSGVFLLVGYGIGLLPLLVTLVTELALVLTAPLEEYLGRKYLASARTRIEQVGPRVVAITGSYGKTSTKNYAAHLLSGRWSVLASPASFNNVMGLSRAVNDRLSPGTDVFVAEMGTYGPGEIEALTRVFPPAVSAITTIGEAHLERMKDRATIVRAKSEILDPAPVVVLNVDVPELAEAADRLDDTKRVIRCSAEGVAGADVVVRRREGSEGWLLELAGTEHEVTLPAEVGHPINVATAVGLALALEVPEKTILERLATLPGTPHRAETTTMDNGLTVIDDTYNANPDGAAQALATASRLAGPSGTVWTITPGMVELGDEQWRRNMELAKAATSGEQHQLCVVGYTNRGPLRAGDPARTHLFESREQAAAHVMATARSGDVVLYENDLPDHYP